MNVTAEVHKCIGQGERGRFDNTQLIPHTKIDQMKKILDRANLTDPPPKEYSEKLRFVFHLLEVIGASSLAWMEVFQQREDVEEYWLREFYWLRTLPEKLAMCLSQYKGQGIHLESLESLTPNFFLQLSKTNKQLCLGLTKVSKELVKVFCHHADWIHLGKIPTLTLEEVQWLRSRKSQLCFSLSFKLDLPLARMLRRKCQGICLPAPSIDSSIAKGLVSNSGRLGITDSYSMDTHLAKSLQCHNGHLDLYSDDPVNAEVISIIAKGHASLMLYGDGIHADIKVLSRHSGGLDLPHLIDPSPGDLSLLIQANGDLALEGLEVLDYATANILFRHRGRLSLKGVTEISHEVSKELAKHWGGLSLNGLKKLSCPQARNLVHSKGALSLNGLNAIDPLVAKELSKHKYGLDLGLRELEEDVAVMLSLCRPLPGYSLSLDLLESINPSEASHLARMKGSLSLGGLKSISTNVARALCLHVGNLKLGGLTELSEEQAFELSMIQGNLYFGNLNRLTPGVARMLSGRGKYTLALGNVFEISNAVARSLASNPGSIALWDLSRLNEYQASLLAEVSGELLLGGLTSLDNKLARILSLHLGKKLYLPNVSDIRMAGIQYLMRHPGRLNLDGLLSINKETAHELAGFPSPVSLVGVIDLDDEVDGILAGTHAMFGLCPWGVGKVVASNDTAFDPFVLKFMFSELRRDPVRALQQVCDHFEQQSARPGDWYRLLATLVPFPRGFGDCHFHSFSGLTHLYPEMARSIARMYGGDIRYIQFDDLKRMDAQALLALDLPNREYLSFLGLEELDDECAEILSNFSGKLNIGSPVLSPNAQALLSKRNDE